MVNNSVEVLFVAGSSLDRRGRRVLIREGGVENMLWPGDDIQDVDIRLLGITKQQQRQIQQFLGERRVR